MNINIFKKLSVIIASIIFFLILLELLLRLFVVENFVVIDKKNNKRTFYDSVIYHSRYGTRLKPNLDVTIKNDLLSHRDIHFVTNSFGFRGKDISTYDLLNNYKILFIGDSVTLGNSLPEEETFIGLLQEAYHKDKSNKNVRLINGGIWDVGIQEEYYILEERGILIKPDLVILDFYLNDSRPPWGFQREQKLNLLKLFKKSRLATYLYQRLAVESYLLRHRLIGRNFRFYWIEKAKKQNWINDRDAFLDLVNSADLDWGVAWQISSWIIVKEYISKIKKLSERYNFNFVIICFPVSFQVEAAFNEDYPQRQLKEICSDLNVVYLDLLPLMRVNKDKNLFFDNCHLNITGNKLVANAVKAFLDKLTIGK